MSPKNSYGYADCAMHEIDILVISNIVECRTWPKV